MTDSTFSFSPSEKLNVLFSSFARLSASIATILLLCFSSSPLLAQEIGTAIEEDLILRPGDSSSNDTSTAGTESFRGVTQSFRISDNILIYPNPATVGETIYLKVPRGAKIEAVEILDFQGRRMRVYGTSALLKQAFSTTGLQQGRYLMRIQAQGVWVSKRLDIK